MEKLFLPTNPDQLRSGFIPKIMIVDDDEAHLQFIKLIMLRENFTCDLTLSNDSIQALEYLQNTEMDLVLLDVMMPEMDGFEMIDKLKKNPVTKDISVIFLTSTQETDYVVRAFEHGVADYIAKPINSAILTARIYSILQRKYLENELKLRNQELERINRFKNELLSVVSHDLRAPLAAIEVICKTWESKLTGESKAAESDLTDKIVNQSRLARRLVDNFLDYNKIEEGMLIPSPSFFSTRELLATCIDDEQPFVLEENIDLESKLPEEDIVAFGDRELLAQAVRNILGNSIKFARGKINLSGDVSGIDEKTGGQLIITIIDDGPGIPADKIGTVFNKYTKLDPNSSGTGLGLFIAKEAVGIQGGSITAASEEGVSTTFTISIPYVYKRQQLPDLSEFLECKVLVISTSKINSQLLEGVLSEGGIVNIKMEMEEKTPPEAIIEDSPDLVVIDLESASLNLFHLAKIITEVKSSLHWMFFGNTSEVEAFSKLANATYSHLSRPLNPLVYLNLFATLMQERYSKDATLFG